MAAKKKVEKIVKSEENIVKSEEKIEKPIEQVKKGPKYPIGSIVFISKEAQADLNGFKLFPPYKKYTYTVEAYDEETKVYSLRRLNLVLKLNECDVVAPDKNASSHISRVQF